MYTSLQYKQALDSLIALKNELFCSIEHCTTQKIDRIVGTFNCRGIVQVVGDLQLMLDDGVNMTKEQAEKTISICKKLIDIYYTNQLAKQGVKPQPSTINFDGIQITAPHYVIDKPTNASLVMYVQPVKKLLDSIMYRSFEPYKQQNGEQYKSIEDKVLGEFNKVKELLVSHQIIKQDGTKWHWQKNQTSFAFLWGMLLCGDKYENDKLHINTYKNLKDYEQYVFVLFSNDWKTPIQQTRTRIVSEDRYNNIPIVYEAIKGIL